MEAEDSDIVIVVEGTETEIIMAGGVGGAGKNAANAMLDAVCLVGAKAVTDWATLATATARLVYFSFIFTFVWLELKSLNLYRFVLSWQR